MATQTAASASNRENGQNPGRSWTSTGLLMAALPAVALGAVNTLGWDRFGPLRWFAIPTIGFALLTIGLKRLQWDGSLLTKALAALAAWGALAAVFAADPLHAWIGTPDRRFGWLTWLLCGGLFLVAQRTDPRERALAVRGFAVGSCLMAGFSFAELAGWTEEIGFGDRLGGPFGQPAFLGAASVIAAPICLGLASDRRTEPAWRAIAMVGACGAAFTLLASQSRAAWLGALLACLLWLVMNGRALRPRLIAFVAGGFAFTVALVLAIAGLRQRLTSSFDDGGVVQGRLDEWQVGLRALRAAPVLGYGPEGYRTVFGRHVDEQYAIDWGRVVITDRAHSGLLDTGLAFGLPGMFLAATLVVLVTVGAVQAMKPDDPIRSGLAVGVIGYLVQQQFLFPLSELDPVFWLAAGLLLPATVFAKPTASLARSMTAGLVGGLTVVVAIAGVLDLVADRQTTEAIENEDLSSVTSLRPDSTRYRFISARVARRSGRFDDALVQLDEGLRLSPADPAFRGERAAVLLDRARATDDEALRQQRLIEARDALDLLVVDDPNNPGYLQNLGIARALNGDVDGATLALEAALMLDPTSPELRANLAEVERQRGGG